MRRGRDWQGIGSRRVLVPGSRASISSGPNLADMRGV